MSANLSTDVVKVPLRVSGEVRVYALVDADKEAEVAGYRWCLGNHGYAVRHAGTENKRLAILLHRQLLGLTPGDGVEVDHLNGDRLDSRLRNLRLLSHAANGQNKNFCTTGTSRFRGVSWYRRDGVWQAQAKLDGKNRHLGLFSSELVAAQVVDAWRLANMPFAQPDPELLRFYEEQNAR